MRWKPPEIADKVDRRSVVNPGQAREFLIALSYVGGRDRAAAAAWWRCSRACTTRLFARPKR
jgi:hypothetical protein